MKIKIIWYVSGALCILIILQSLVLSSKKNEMYRMPIFLPLVFEPKQNKDASHGDLMSGITVDDLVRGMLSMEKDKSLSLAASQVIQVRPLLQEMAEKRKNILELRNKRHQLNEYSMDTGIMIAQSLTPEQFAYIINNRDEAVLLLEKKPYWEELLESLKNNK